jgi:hypothetical protein
MPNHITNILEITGNNTEIRKLKSLVTTTFNIESFYPTPNDLNPGNLILWRRKNWGTKCDVYEVSKWEDMILTGEVPNNTYLSKISFLSAWTTPAFAIHKLSELFPTLIFNCKYADEDMGYNCGSYTMMNGGIIDHNIFKDYSNDSLNYAESIIEESNKIHNKLNQIK